LLLPPPSMLADSVPIAKANFFAAEANFSQRLAAVGVVLHHRIVDTLFLTEINHAGWSGSHNLAALHFAQFDIGTGAIPFHRVLPWRELLPT